MAELRDKLAGKFLVIDGPDGAGKSTQVSLLADWLDAQGVSLCRVRDPGGTAIGNRIRQILLDTAHGEMAVECELMLYMASRAQLAAEVIRPALRRGGCILSDRYISATVAYQGAGGVDPEAVIRAGRIAVGETWPDLTLIVDVDAEVGLRRLAEERTRDRMEAKGAAFHRRVREMFRLQAEREPNRFAIVDGSPSVQQVHEALRRVVEEWPWRR